MDRCSKLESLASAIYGPEWVSPLARDLGINVRSLQRWLSGERQMPDDLLARPELRQAAESAADSLAGRLALVRSYLGR